MPSGWGGACTNRHTHTHLWGRTYLGDGHAEDIDDGDDLYSLPDALTKQDGPTFRELGRTGRTCALKTDRLAIEDGQTDTVRHKAKTFGMIDMRLANSHNRILLLCIYIFYSYCNDIIDSVFLFRQNLLSLHRTHIHTLPQQQENPANLTDSNCIVIMFFLRLIKHTHTHTFPSRAHCTMTCVFLISFSLYCNHNHNNK